MAAADNSTNPSTRCALAIATPLRAYLAESDQGVGIPTPAAPPLDADAIVRELIANAGILPDATPDGCHVVMVALSPHLLEALSAYVPTAPQPLPLLEWRE